MTSAWFDRLRAEGSLVPAEVRAEVHSEYAARLDAWQHPQTQEWTEMLRAVEHLVGWYRARHAPAHPQLDEHVTTVLLLRLAGHLRAAVVAPHRCGDACLGALLPTPDEDRLPGVPPPAAVAGRVAALHALGPGALERVLDAADAVAEAHLRDATHHGDDIAWTRLMSLRERLQDLDDQEVG